MLTSQGRCFRQSKGQTTGSRLVFGVVYRLLAATNRRLFEEQEVLRRDLRPIL